MSHKKRSTLEKLIQRDIEADLGAEKDLVLLKNSVGVARFPTADGKEYFVPYGLGKGSPDLVGLLRVEVTTSIVPRRRLVLGQWFCLEVKADEGELDDDQKKCHKVWREFGGAFIEVVKSVEEARAALERARRLEL